MDKPTPGDLVALEALIEDWLARAQDAADKALNLSRIGASRAEFYRGQADAYRRAAAELRALLADESGEDQAAPVEYAQVSLDTAQTVLKLAGLSAAELRAHPDRTFSILFLPLQFRSVGEVSEMLMDVADVDILDSGRLLDTNKSFVDFAFKSPPV
ncbi:MAG: hypothetical protein HXY41_07215 [Chloroflexi bacterium]|nr:hypothetical protein [Chloroflexota bacterium]